MWAEPPVQLFPVVPESDLQHKASLVQVKLERESMNKCHQYTGEDVQNSYEPVRREAAEAAPTKARPRNFILLGVEKES